MTTTNNVKKVTILDLGINNIHSVKRAFTNSRHTLEVSIRQENGLLENTGLIVLPGLGSFGTGIEAIRSRKLDRYLNQANRLEVPILGICLGMQLLGEKSEESPNVEGLGLIPGEIKLLPSEPQERIPNVGWMGGTSINDGEKFPSLSQGKDFYFVHSFYFAPKNSSHSIFVSRYGTAEITTGILDGTILGFQFHPEKSSKIGATLIRDILNWGFHES